jgi:hypothetical protein
MEPGSREIPMPVRHAIGDTKRSRSLADVQSGKVVQLDDLRRQAVRLGERFQQIADQNHFLGRWAGRCRLAAQLKPRKFAAVFGPPLLSRPFDKNSSHRLGCGGKEVTAAVPVVIRSEQSQIRLVHKIGALQRLAWCFACELFAGQPAKLLVDKRQQLICGVNVPRLDSLQKLGYFAHLSPNCWCDNFFPQSAKNPSLPRRIINQRRGVVCSRELGGDTLLCGHMRGQLYKSPRDVASLRGK